MDACRSADAMRVIGSSLMLYSSYRFAHATAQAGKPVAAVTPGRTRADALLALKVGAPCTEASACLLPATPACAAVAAGAPALPHSSPAVPPHLILLQSKSTSMPRPTTTDTFGCSTSALPSCLSVTV